MRLPFNIEQFLNVFEKYNTEVFPAQVIAYLLGVILVISLFTRNRNSDRIITGTLALYWIWMGAVYHIHYFREINPVASLFGALFILQGLFFLTEVIWDRLKFFVNVRHMGLSQVLGLLFILYAMVAYPLLLQFSGHPYPFAPVFGLAPCPTVIFTFGIMLCTTDRIARHIIIIPFFWSLVGFFAALNLGMTEDYGLAVAGILGILRILLHNRPMIISRL